MAIQDLQRALDEAVAPARGTSEGAAASYIPELANVDLEATRGLYDQSGAHPLATGLPARSGVSGVIVAVATGRAGVALASPRVNGRGGSVRGHLILGELARRLDWHLALQQGSPCRQGPFEQAP